MTAVCDNVPAVGSEVPGLTEAIPSYLAFALHAVESGRNGLVYSCIFKHF